MTEQEQALKRQSKVIKHLGQLNKMVMKGTWPDDLRLDRITSETDPDEDCIGLFKQDKGNDNSWTCIFRTDIPFMW